MADEYTAKSTRKRKSAVCIKCAHEFYTLPPIPRPAICGRPECNPSHSPKMDSARKIKGATLARLRMKHAVKMYQRERVDYD